MCKRKRIKLKSCSRIIHIDWWMWQKNYCPTPKDNIYINRCLWMFTPTEKPRFSKYFWHMVLLREFPTEHIFGSVAHFNPKTLAAKLDLMSLLSPYRWPRRGELRIRRDMFSGSGWWKRAFAEDKKKNKERFLPFDEHPENAFVSCQKIQYRETYSCYLLSNLHFSCCPSDSVCSIHRFSSTWSL